MTKDNGSNKDLDEVGARIARLQDRRKKEHVSGNRNSGLGLALKMGVDLVAACFVGGFIGYLIDGLLGTKPWIMGIMFILGVVAGMKNMIRSAQNAQISGGE